MVLLDQSVEKQPGHVHIHPRIFTAGTEVTRVTEQKEKAAIKRAMRLKRRWRRFGSVDYLVDRNEPFRQLAEENTRSISLQEADRVIINMVQQNLQTELRRFHS